MHSLFSALPRHRGRLFCTPVSLIHAIDLPTILSPITCACSVSPRHVTCRWIGPRLLPHEAKLNGNSGLRHSLADSPHYAGRIEFLIVRTGRSPPAAPHPVSPRRSCRLITSYVNSERTSTSRIVCPLRRTGAGFLPVGGLCPKFKRLVFMRVGKSPFRGGFCREQQLSRRNCRGLPVVFPPTRRGYPNSAHAPGSGKMSDPHASSTDPLSTIAVGLRCIV